MSIPPKVEDLKPTDEQLTKWKKNGIISDFQGKNLNISEKEGWKNNLVIKNCLELENFYCNNLISSRKLEGLAIENCPKLECLDASNNNLKIVRFKEVNNLEDVYLSNNKLTKFDASNLPNVKNLDVSANQLINLTLTKREKLVNLNCANNRLEKITDLGDCQSLQGLYCHNNPFYLNGLEVKKLTNLKYLYCQHCYILEADISDLEFLEHFVCYGKKFIGTVDKFRIDGLRSVKINNCKNLKVLDLGESCLEELLVSNCPTLFIVSVRQNSLKALIFLDCPKLYYVDFCRQIYPPISGVTFDKSVDEEVVKNYKFNFVHFSTELLIDNSPVLGEVYYAHNTTFCNNDGEKIDKDEWKRFYPRITVLEEKSSWENVNFDRVLDRMLLAEEKAKQKKKKNNTGVSNLTEESPIIIDPATLTSDYEEREDKNTVTDLDISHMEFDGKMIIENYPKLKSLNIGNNFLSYLVVRDCPQLTTLRYAHNAMLHDAFIDNCLKLKTIDKYKYDDPSWNKDLEDKFNKGKLTGRENFNQQAKPRKKLNEKVKNLLANIEKGETNALAEFIKAFQGKSFEFIFADLNEENQEKFTKFFVPKLEEHFKNLIANHAKMGENKFIEEVKKIVPFKAYLSEELNQQLTNLLKIYLEEINNNSPTTKNYWPIIFGFSAIILVTIGLIFWLINRLVKKIQTK